MSKELKSTVAQYSDQFATHMVAELFKHIDKQRSMRGDEFANLLPAAFLSRFVGALIFRILKAPIAPGTTEEGAYHQQLHNYGLVKLEIQEAVSLGFQTAMTLHSGVPNEYYCQIKVVPPPQSDKVN